MKSGGRGDESNAEERFVWKVEKNVSSLELQEDSSGGWKNQKLMVAVGRGPIVGFVFNKILPETLDKEAGNLRS
jgi:hypothetical protein